MVADDIAIRRLVAADAPALARCFERCYGKSYVVADFYDPPVIAERVERENLRSVVAVSPSGEIVGHMGLTIRDPRAQTVDAGNSVVDPAHRGRGVGLRLAAGVTGLCREAGFLGFHHYPTTAHPIMQRMAVDGGGIETGIMLGYIPSGTEYREMDGDPSRGRLAALVVYQPLVPAPERRVFGPESLVAAIDAIYRRGSLARVVEPGFEPLASTPSRVETRFDARRALLRIDVSFAGSGLRERVLEALEGTESVVQQIDLRMAERSITAAIDVVRELGFFFSAILPEYLDGDVLRLQRAAGDAPPPNLVTDDAREIFRTITVDRRRSAPR
jgi:serine/threonine-protein kinase RsbW